MEKIREGVRLRRIVSAAAAPVGHEYVVHRGNWNKGTLEGDDLIADGGFIRELLSDTRLKEYEIIEQEKTA